MDKFIRENVKCSNGVLCNMKDIKTYKIITLSNGLEILFAFHPLTTKSGACLTVRTGHSDDYMDKLGIAHFIEHMLFLGNEKYRGSNDYFDYVNSHGGSSNAYTSIDHTKYFFDIETSHMEKAIDIFGHFFINPLLDKKFIEKEVHAVHSEHMKNKFNDSWRGFEIGKKGYNPDHSATKFGTGTLTTLLPDNSTEGVAELTRKVRLFFNENYSSDKMRLIIFHDAMTQEFIDYISSIFSKVTRKRKINVRDRNIQLVIPKDHVRTILVQPYTDVHKISINWHLKASYDRRGNKILDTNMGLELIAGILGHEGNGSLFAMLKKKGWITHLMSGCEKIMDDDHIFSVSVILSQSGIKYINQIVKHIYGIVMFIQEDIKRNTEYYQRIAYEEIVNRKLRFVNGKDMDPLGFMKMYSSVHDRYLIDTRNLLIASVFTSDDLNVHIENLQEMINRFNPYSSFVVITTNKINMVKSQTEETYGIKFRELKTNVKKCIQKKYVRDLLPKTNPFINDSLLYVPIHQDNAPGIVHYNSSQGGGGGYEGVSMDMYGKDHLIYVDYENPFREMKIYIVLDVIYEELLVKSDVTKLLEAELYIEYITQFHNDKIYEYSQSGCDISLDMNGPMLKIIINCFPDHIRGIDGAPSVLDTILGWIRNTETTDQVILDIMKTSMNETLDNFDKAEPYVKLQKILGETYVSKYIHTTGQAKQVLLTLDMGAISQNLKNANVFVNGEIRCLITGNVDKSISDSLCNKIYGFVNYTKHKIFDYTSDTRTSSTHIKKNVNKDDENSACLILYVMDDILNRPDDDEWMRKTALINILESIVGTDYFHIMRTVKQYGYIARTTKKDINMFGPLVKKCIAFSMQSPKISAYEILSESIDAINNTINSKITNMTTDEFQSIKDSYITKLNLADTNIGDRIRRLIKAVKYHNINGNANFKFNKTLIPIVDNLSVEDLKSYFNHKMVLGSTVLTIGIDSIARKN